MTSVLPSAPPRSNDRVIGASLLISGALWLAMGLAARNRAIQSEDDWRGPYAVFAILLFLAALTSTCSVAMYTSSSTSSRGRSGAIAVAVAGVVSTVMAWAFPVWAVLLAAGFAALGASGAPGRRDAVWPAVALLVGLAVAIVGVLAKLGPAGAYDDYTEAQGWGLTVAGVLACAASVVLGLRARRRGAHDNFMAAGA